MGMGMGMGMRMVLLVVAKIWVGFLRAFATPSKGHQGQRLLGTMAQLLLNSALMFMKWSVMSDNLPGVQELLTVPPGFSVGCSSSSDDSNYSFCSSNADGISKHFAGVT